MIRLSAGLRNAIITNYGLGVMMEYGHIRVYSGPQPTTASDAPSGTLLALVSLDGTPPVPGTLAGGVQLQAGQATGSLVKRGTWRMKGVASGTAGWWRFVGNAYDDNSLSLDLPRIDGSVGDSFALPSPAITSATNLEIVAFSIFLPSQ